jgi:hypothetical protein
MQLCNYHVFINPYKLYENATSMNELPSLFSWPTATSALEHIEHI